MSCNFRECVCVCGGVFSDVGEEGEKIIGEEDHRGRGSQGEGVTGNRITAGEWGQGRDRGERDVRG